MAENVNYAVSTASLLSLLAEKYKCNLYIMPLSYTAIGVDDIHKKELQEQCNKKYEFEVLI